jgi:hypothetical protein
MQHILTRHIIGGKYSKWIVILQEFDLEFSTSKSKKSLAFAELMSNFPKIVRKLWSTSPCRMSILFLIDLF